MSVEYLALALTGFLTLVNVAFNVATYVRSGSWNAKSEVASLARTLTAHDERLKTVETRISELPTAAAVVEIKHAVDRLDIGISGKLETLNVRMVQGDRERALNAQHGERERLALSTALDRVEEFLMTQAREGAKST